MGPLHHLAAHALAGVLRELKSASSPYPTGDALLPWLTQRLADNTGELLRVVHEVCERAWEAIEVILRGDALFAQFGKLKQFSAEQQLLASLMAEVYVTIPPDRVMPRDQQAGFVEQLRPARLSHAVLAGSCQTEELATAVARLVPLADAALKEEETRFFARLANHFTDTNFFLLAYIFEQPKCAIGPLLIQTARTFLLFRVQRHPRLLWGAEVMAKEPPARRERRGLRALDDLQTQHPGLLGEWLAQVVPGRQPPETVVTDDDMELSMEDEADSYSDSIAMDEDAEEAPPPPAPAAPPPPPRPSTPPPPVTRAAPPPPRPSAAPAAPAPRRRDEAVASRAAAPRQKAAEAEETPVDSGPLKRRANVRWFKRMNPQRMYPLTVVLAKGRVREVKVKGVAQAVSAEQLVVTADNPFITVRPVLPGVKVYPPEQTVDVTAELVSVRFHVLPQTLGEVPDARIEFFWRQRLISRIDLPMKVRKQTLAVVVSIAGILWPFLANAAKAMGADQDRSKDFAMQALGEFLRWPYAIEAGLAFLAVAAVLFYWINRPRESSEDTDVLSVKPMSLEELLSEGQRCLTQEHWDEARSYFEDAVNVAADSKPAKHGLHQAQQKRRFPLWEMKQ